MKRNVWSAGRTALLAVSFLGMTPFAACAAEPVPEGVYIGDVSLSGLTEEEAEKKIEEYAGERLGLELTLIVNGSEVRTDGTELGLRWSNEEAMAEALEETKVTGNLIRRYMKKKDLQESPVRFELDLDVDQEKVNAFVQDKCGAAVTEAADASIRRENGAFVITPEVVGTTVDMEATKQAINEALNGAAGEITVHAELVESQPAVTEETLSTIQDVLGTFSTDFSSSGASRATNLQVGASKIDGHVLMPGEVLSGYDCMNPFTTQNGYRTAVAYENGRSVDSIGGGVCQISTTLYNASLLAELEIVQRQNHSMSVSYVKPSMDAAIAGTYKDLKIKNPYDTPIYIEGYTSGRTLTFTIYGKETRPSNRTIKFESETLQWMDPGAPAEQIDPTLAPGQRVRVQSAHTGLRSRLYKCVYVDGQLTERTLLNNDTYNPSKAIFRVGPPAETTEQLPETLETPAQTEQTPQQPEETSPAATEPQPTESQPQGPGYETEPQPTTQAVQPTEAPQPTAPVETPAPQPDGGQQAAEVDGNGPGGPGA